MTQAQSLDHHQVDEESVVSETLEEESQTPTQEENPASENTPVKEAEQPPAKPEQGTLKVEASLLKRAKSDEFEAVALMFRQFIPEDEEIAFAEYLGVDGFWGMGVHSFGCLTNRRVATIQFGFFGEVTYQDGYIEDINSGKISQPSKLLLYLGVALSVIIFLTGCSFLLSVTANGLVTGIPTLIAAVVLFRLIPKVYHRFYKCGVEFWVKEGKNVHFLTNRNRLIKANRLYRTLTQLREQRLAIKRD